MYFGNQWPEFQIATPETTISLRRLGSGPALLLLHGFPETHLMWRDIAPLLAQHFTVICADLRGYGHSGCPPSTPDHAPYSKRAMANDMIWKKWAPDVRGWAVKGGHFFPEEAPAEMADAFKEFFSETA